MERIFSVDDILGTFWKVEGQGTDGSATPAAVAAAAAAGMPPGYPLAMTLPPGAWTPQQLPNSSQQPSSELQRPIPRTGSFQRMNRIPSEWAFQDFLRDQALAGMPSILSHISSLEKLPFTDSPTKAKDGTGKSGTDQEEKKEEVNGKGAEDSSDSESEGSLEKKTLSDDASRKGKVRV